MQSAQLEAVDAFLAHLRTERRLSAHTVSGYAQDLGEVIGYCEHKRVASWRELTHAHVRGFAARAHARGAAPRSIQRKLSALRTFFAYLQREGLARDNPAVSVRAPKPARRLPRALDADQMSRLLEFRASDALSRRDKAIMELLYSSALRLAELVSLNCTDVDLRDATVRVTGKGNKTRIVPLGTHAREAVRVWLEERVQWLGGAAAALFVSERGARIGARAVQLRIAAWGRRQGIPVHVHPHMFRHSCASHLLESSQDLRAVQEFLGHANVSSTQIYTHLDFQHLAKVYDSAHPRAKCRSA